MGWSKPWEPSKVSCHLLPLHMSTESKITKEEKKRQAEKDRERRMVGVIPLQPQFFLDAGKRVRTAWVWIPRLRMIVMASSAISVVALLGCLIAVYSRPEPMVFLSFPDGSIACGPRLDGQGRLVQRSREDQAVCDRIRPPVGIDMSAANLSAPTAEASDSSPSQPTDQPE